MVHVAYQPAQRGRRGFTLIETIAALVILAVALPPMMFALRQSTIDRIDPIRFSQARWLAAERLEDIIADRHSTTRGYDWVTGDHYPAEAAVPSNLAFARRVTIAETGPDLASAGSGYKTVTVTLSWVDSKHQPRSLEVATVLTELQP